MDNKSGNKQAATSRGKADRLSRVIVAVMTCLGALGLCALLFFPLYFKP